MQEILYFYFDDDTRLVLCKELGTLSLMSISTEKPVLMLGQKQFTNSELSLLHPLLEHYPRYCPHEVMFASFYNSSITEKTITNARQHLQKAISDGSWDHELRPMRNTLSRTRLKLKNLGMDVRSILETGYILLHLQGDTDANRSASPLLGELATQR